MIDSLELPHWLMIVGAVLVVLGFIGALVSRKKLDDIDLKPGADESTPKAQMPPLPKLRDSRGKTAPQTGPAESRGYNHYFDSNV